MPKKEAGTGEFLRRLRKTSDIITFIKTNSEEMEEISFHDYINGLCTEKDILPARVIERAGIERTFGHQLFNGRRNPSRDKVIQLALGFEMVYTEAQDLLQAARKNALYPKTKRDAVIIFALENKLSYTDVQTILHELALPLISE